MPDIGIYISTVSVLSDMNTFFKEIIMQKKFTHNLYNKLKTSSLYYKALSQVFDNHI